MRTVKSAALEKNEIEHLKAIANISCISDVECYKCPLGIRINGIVECFRNLSEQCLIINKINPHTKEK